MDTHACYIVTANRIARKHFHESDTIRQLENNVISDHMKQSI